MTEPPENLAIIDGLFAARERMAGEDGLDDMVADFAAMRANLAAHRERLAGLAKLGDQPEPNPKELTP